MSAHWIWMVIALYGSAAWVATTWIRARYNDSTGSFAGGRNMSRSGRRRMAVPDDAFSSQERELARLEARVRVLERIVTDRKAELEREFERLRADG